MVSFEPAPPKVAGKETPVFLKIESPHSVRRLSVFVEQNGKRFTALERSEPATRLRFFRSGRNAEIVTVNIGSAHQKDLKAGKAKLVVEVQANDFRAMVSTLSQDIEVILTPPTLAVDSAQHYINHGGAELVTFNVSGYWTEAGVRVGKYTFRSFQMPDSKDPGQRLSLFVFPWDTPPDTTPVVFARNPAQEVTAKFWFKVFPKKFRKRDLDIPDSFIEKVVAELDPGGSGDLLDRFLKVNGPLRRQNNTALSNQRLNTTPAFLFNKPFKQLTNSKVESQFADQRTYIYKGKKVDEQVHQGFDLSVTRNVPVVAANDGKVVYASNLGIYGNCVVIDHGYGLQSIYAHLSSIETQPGQMVGRDQVVGKSGSTGLAGGDHLHFSMQIDGVQTNPVEWWDDHWIKDRVASKVKLKVE